MSEQGKDSPEPPVKMNLAKGPREFVHLDNPDTPEPILPIHEQAVKKQKSPLRLLAYLWPLTVMTAFGVGGYFGYNTIVAQNARLEASEHAALVETGQRDAAALRISELTPQIADFDRRIAEIPERAGRDARIQSDRESSDELASLRLAIAETKNTALKTLRENEAKARERTTGLKTQVLTLRSKLDADYDSNRDMKVYLNTNNRTMHGAFPIGPRP